MAGLQHLGYRCQLTCAGEILMAPTAGLASPTEIPQVSWAGLCPRARQSGPRTRSGKKNQGDSWLRGALGQAATGASRTTTFLGERYGGSPAAAQGQGPGPVARSILTIIWHLLATRPPRTPTWLRYYQARTDKDRRSGTTSGRSKRCWPPHHHHAQGRLTHTVPDQPDHRASPSAAARPFTLGNFPVIRVPGRPHKYPTDTTTFRGTPRHSC